MSDFPSQVYRERLVLSPSISRSIAGRAGMDLTIVAVHLASAAALVVQIDDEAGSMLPLVSGAGVPCTLPQLDPGWARSAEGSGATVLNGGAGTVEGVLIYRYIPHGTEL